MTITTRRLSWIWVHRPFSQNIRHDDKILRLLVCLCVCVLEHSFPSLTCGRYCWPVVVVAVASVNQRNQDYQCFRNRTRQHRQQGNNALLFFVVVVVDYSFPQSPLFVALFLFGCGCGFHRFARVESEQGWRWKKICEYNYIQIIIKIVFAIGCSQPTTSMIDYVKSEFVGGRGGNPRMSHSWPCQCRAS